MTILSDWGIIRVMRTVIFSEDVRDFILGVFDKKVGDDGYIVEKNTGSRAITPGGDFVSEDNFAAIVPGSEVFVTNDMPSLLKYANREMADGEAA